MESTLDSGSYWILQGIFLILMLIGKLLLLILYDIPPSAKCYPPDPPVAGIWRQGLICRLSWGGMGFGLWGVVDVICIPGILMY
jgi:hypothetical protein